MERKTGKFVNNGMGEMIYKSFCPAPLPPQPAIELTNDLLLLVIEANKAISKLNGVTKFIPNIDLFVSMYVRKEALISSQIEGTQCTLDDIFSADIQKNVNLDVADVVNYVHAMQFALKRQETLPLCCRLLKEIHAELLSGVRGSEKTPGEFRHSQNWIGGVNCNLREARYIPPNVQDMKDAMSDLEKFINENNDYDPLIQAALIHYQFETIHPFLDGNGRIGRMLIILYLIKKNILQSPIIYISLFLKKNQIEYYDRLSEVRRNGNFEQWIKFFLEAVLLSSQDAFDTINKLVELLNKNTLLLPKTNRKKDNLRLVFDYIQQFPIIEIGQMAKRLHISFNTATNAVLKLMELNILRETTNAERGRIFAYEDYLTILRG